MLSDDPIINDFLFSTNKHFLSL